jgi:hypothetical protein
LETTCNSVNVHGAQVAYTRYFCPTFSISRSSLVAAHRAHILYTLQAEKGKAGRVPAVCPSENTEVQSTECRDRFMFASRLHFTLDVICWLRELLATFFSQKSMKKFPIIFSKSLYILNRFLTSIFDDFLENIISILDNFQARTILYFIYRSLVVITSFPSSLLMNNAALNFLVNELL